LKDIYFAEKQILRALPKMAKEATCPELKEAFETHREETENQVERLNQFFNRWDAPGFEFRPLRQARAHSLRIAFSVWGFSPEVNRRAPAY
jgi:hypothetical protein